MSYKATAWAYDLTITGPQKFVLVALADMADEAGSCFPGQDRLAAMTGLSKSTVKRSLEKLEAQELITRERRNDRYGHRTSDRYYLALGRQSLEVTVPTRQSAYKAEGQSLGVTLTSPRGHSDPLITRRTTRDPSGGRDAPAPDRDQPQPTVAQKLGDGHVPWCKRHPDGTDQPCAACGRARIAYEEWVVQAAKPQPRLDPSVYCEHGQFIGKCWVCDEEQRRAVAILEEQFGPTR